MTRLRMFNRTDRVFILKATSHTSGLHSPAVFVSRCIIFQNTSREVTEKIKYTHLKTRWCRYSVQIIIYILVPQLMRFLTCQSFSVVLNQVGFCPALGVIWPCQRNNESTLCTSQVLPVQTAAAIINTFSCRGVFAVALNDKYCTWFVPTCPDVL